MVECPIIRQEIDEAECATVCKESYKEGKEKVILHSKFRKVNFWKAVCKSCKSHKK